MSVAELRRTLTKLADTPEPAVKTACKTVEQYAASIGGSVRLGSNKRRTKLTATTKIRTSGTTVSATVVGEPAGPWVWKTTGTDAHMIAPRGRGRRSVMGGGLRHPVSVPIRHRGTRGKGAWDKVAAHAAKVVPAEVEKQIGRVIASG